MQASDVVDRETLQNWLATRPEADSLAIAQRGALRIAPLWFSAMALDWARKNDLTALPLLRLVLTTGVAAVDQCPEVTSALHAADEAAAIAICAAESSAERDAETAKSYAAAQAATEAAAVGRIVVQALNTASTANGLLSHPGPFFAATISSSLEYWGIARFECLQLEQGKTLQGVDLWPEMECPLGTAWLVAKDLWAEHAVAYDFWRRWYDAALKGRHLNPELEREIALIPATDWEMGPNYIAAIIAQKEARHRRKA